MTELKSKIEDLGLMQKAINDAQNHYVGVLEEVRLLWADSRGLVSGVTKLRSTRNGSGSIFLYDSVNEVRWDAAWDDSTWINAKLISNEGVISENLATFDFNWYEVLPDGF